MVRPLTSLVVALALLAPGLAWPSPSAATPGGAHACCLRARAQMTGCATRAITCCPTPERGRHGATPAGAPAAGATPLQVLHADHDGVAAEPPALRALAFEAHAFARANAPPGPLYLKHLTLLV